MGYIVMGTTDVGNVYAVVLRRSYNQLDPYRSPRRRDAEQCDTADRAAWLREAFAREFPGVRDVAVYREVGEDLERVPTYEDALRALAALPLTKEEP